MKPPDFSTRTRVVTGAVAGVALVLATGANAAGYCEFPAPFYWLDVALVYFLAALPMAATLADALSERSGGRRQLFSILAFEIVVLVFVPNFYVRARTQNDIRRASGYLQQSRYGEASRLLHRTLDLAPQSVRQSKWNGERLADVVGAMDRTVERLENSVRNALPLKATEGQIIQRSQMLAMLGRTADALAVLQSSTALDSNAEVGNLRGTIYETRREWITAREWYDRGKMAWETQDHSEARTAGLSRAVTGIAFCERKLGHLREAEIAWQELLALAPTEDRQANAHFLLAQFYEDTQQAVKSQFHVRRAMQLNPDRYADAGHQLLDKLATSHFGCVGIVQSTPR